MHSTEFRRVPLGVSLAKKSNLNVIFSSQISSTFFCITGVLNVLFRSDFQDDIQSPDGSVSRDSGPTVKSVSSVSSPVEVISPTRELRNSRRNESIGRSDAEASTSSSIAAISAALDSVTKMSKRSSRTQKRVDSRTRRNGERDGETRGKKRCLDSESEDRMSDCSYRESREKNNEASRKSRMNKKAKENEMLARSTELERDNRILKMKVEELEKLVTSMRTTILRSALKRSF